MNFETLTLRLAHNLILGYVPKMVTEEILQKAVSDNPPEISSFGLFGSDIAFNTYYPEVTPEDLTPKDSEFVEPLFRALSEVIVNKNWDPVSFKKPGVLKSSLKLLVGQSVYPNHEREVGNELGSIAEAYWQDEYTSKEGIKIPSGINVKLKIDGKSNPKIARGLMMKPPSVHSSSVTVSFTWEQSHPELSEDDFRRLRGTIGVNGEMIMKVVNKIIAYHEISLVPHGADPFAQIIKDSGDINNPKYAKQRESFKAKLFDFKSVTEDFEIETIQNSDINIQNENKMELKDFLAQLDLGELKFDNMAAFAAHFKTLSDNALLLSKVTEKTGADPLAFIENLEKNQKAEGDSEILTFVEDEGGIEKIKGLKTLAETQLNASRSEAVRFYKALHGDEAKAEIIENINKSEAEAARSFMETYKKEFDEKVPLTCKDCGSENIDRSSFIDPESVKPSKEKPKSFDELRNHFSNGSGVKASTLHGE